MAVTVLRHLKESKKGNPAAHLKHSITYICNPEKTDHGQLIFSNCGTTPDEIYESMMQTKELYQKKWGRQGYHYVISLPPGEGSEDIIYRVAKEFCGKLLSDFDYVFAVHNDQDHLHAHIIFNSVNKNDGYKYRYNNGDWAKLIQPVTDRLCEKYGLSTLSYEKDGPRVGRSYAEHMAEKTDRLTHRDMIRMDIDAAVQASVSEVEYFDHLKQRGYVWRIGHSKNHGEYVSYHMPGVSRSIRDYTLGDQYKISVVRQRLAVDELTDVTDPYLPLKEKTAVWFPEGSLPVYRMSELTRPRYQVCMIRRIDQAVRHYSFDLTIEDQKRVRRDLLQIDRLREECEYLMDTDLGSIEELKTRLAEVKSELKELPYDDSAKADRLLLYSERRILKRLIKDYDDTLAVREAAVVSGKEMRYGREEAIEERDAYIHEKDSPGTAHIG